MARRTFKTPFQPLRSKAPFPFGIPLLFSEYFPAASLIVDRQRLSVRIASLLL